MTSSQTHMVIVELMADLTKQKGPGKTGALILQNANFKKSA
jgi:hypothetical protein